MILIYWKRIYTGKMITRITHFLCMTVVILLLDYYFDYYYHCYHCYHCCLLLHCCRTETAVCCNASVETR
jgi:hypothetical protein